MSRSRATRSTRSPTASPSGQRPLRGWSAITRWGPVRSWLSADARPTRRSISAARSSSAGSSSTISTRSWRSRSSVLARWRRCSRCRVSALVARPIACRAPALGLPGRVSDSGVLSSEGSSEASGSTTTSRPSTVPWDAATLASWSRARRGPDTLRAASITRSRWARVNRGNGSRPYSPARARTRPNGSSTVTPRPRWSWSTSAIPCSGTSVTRARLSCAWKRYSRARAASTSVRASRSRRASVSPELSAERSSPFTRSRERNDLGRSSPGEELPFSRFGWRTRCSECGRTAPGGDRGDAGQRARQATSQAATSWSFVLVVWDARRRRAKASSASTSYWFMRMPLA